MYEYPQSLGTDGEVKRLDDVWWKANDRDPLRLGKVLGWTDCYLVVQTGHDRYRDVMVAPRWKFYRYEAGR